MKHNKGTNQVCNILRKSYLVSGVNDIWPHFYYWGIIQTTDRKNGLSSTWVIGKFSS